MLPLGGGEDFDQPVALQAVALQLLLEGIGRLANRNVSIPRHDLPGPLIGPYGALGEPAGAASGLLLICSASMAATKSML